MGTVTITQSSTEVDYVVTLTNGAIWVSGLTTFFADVTGSIANVSVGGTNAPSGVTFTAGGAPGNADGLKGNNAWDVSAQCGGAAGGSVNCGTTLELIVTGTNLGVGSELFSNGGNSNQVFAGLDVTCSSGNLNSSNTACAANSPVTTTGVVGATAVAVPGPTLGAGLPGLVAACMGLVAFARRRRFRFA